MHTYGGSRFGRNERTSATHRDSEISPGNSRSCSPGTRAFEKTCALSLPSRARSARTCSGLARAESIVASRRRPSEQVVQTCPLHDASRADSDRRLTTGGWSALNRPFSTVSTARALLWRRLRRADHRRVSLPRLQGYCLYRN